LAVALSKRSVEPQSSKSWYGGTQLTTRHATGPLHPISVWHWP
jgi:hypothetical protein